VFLNNHVVVVTFADNLPDFPHRRLLFSKKTVALSN